MKYLRIVFVSLIVIIFVLSIQNIILKDALNYYEILSHTMIVWGLLYLFLLCYNKFRNESIILFILIYILIINTIKFFLGNEIHYQNILLDLALVIIYIELISKITLKQIFSLFIKNDPK